jgi:hypothetical protein
MSDKQLEICLQPDGTQKLIYSWEEQGKVQVIEEVWSKTLPNSSGRMMLARKEYEREGS